MMTSTDEQMQALLNILVEYNQCFYDRDINALEAMYCDSTGFVFWDNHPGCDSRNLGDHLRKVGDFFAAGKSTESGDVEPLIIDAPCAQVFENTAIITAIFRYKSTPSPGVRSTFVVRSVGTRWKIAHVHHSFDPSEVSGTKA